MRLPEFSVRRPVTTLMTFLVVIIIGGVCLWLLPIDMLPKMDIPVITVITTYEGAAPEDVEAKVTDTLEQFLSTIPDLKHITSKSKEGISVIALGFEWDTELDTRANEVRDAVGMAKIHLPDEVDEPRVLKLNIANFPILMYGVTAEESFPDLKEILEDEVANPLKRLPGVGAASVRVILQRQVNVYLDRERLAAYQLTPQDVVYAIARENQDTPAGNLKMGLTDYIIRVPGEFGTVEPMRQIVLARRGASVVRLGDVGSVEYGYAEKNMHVTMNGNPRAGILMIQKESGANTVAVARSVHKRLRELQKKLPADIKLISLIDYSEYIEWMIRDLSQTLLIGGCLAMLVVLVFLGRWRASLIIGLTIPFSLIAVIIVVFFLGYTINMMTLFGMIIAIGMVVDNAIVILENIIRHRELGERPTEGAIYGASEVAMAITASTLTTVCVFFPILFVRGITKILFAEFAVVVIVVMCCSLFSAVTLTPMLSATLIRRAKFDRKKSGWLSLFGTSILPFVEKQYGRVLDWALKHRFRVVVLALMFFGSAIVLTPFLGTEFMPEEDQAMIMSTVQMPVGTRVEETARTMVELAKLVEKEIPVDERLGVFTRCGTTPEAMASAFGDEGAHVGLFTVKLVPRQQRSRNVKQITAALRRRIDASQSLLGFEKYKLVGGDPMSGLIMGGDQALVIDIVGNDLEATDRLAAQIKTIAENTPGAVDIAVSRVKGKPEIWVKVKRDRAAALGLNVSDIGTAVRSSFYGRTASKYRVHGDEYDIFVKLREADRQDIRAVLATPVRLPDGRLVRVGDVADLAEKRGPLEIERKDQGRIVKVTGGMEGRSLGDLAADIEAKIKQLEIPPGIEVTMAGQVEELRESFLWLTLALCVGIVLVYMVMASLFESLLHPFVVMFSVPFAFTGAIWALFLGGHHISVVVFLGLLMLVGIVVNNAIVLVDYINILRARGLELADAVRDAGMTRLRPVLMTALTTIVALLPMAFGKGQGAESWNPLGLTMLGGLLVATFVTLVLVPTIYSIFAGRSSPKPVRKEAP